MNLSKYRAFRLSVVATVFGDLFPVIITEVILDFINSLPRLYPPSCKTSFKEEAIAGGTSINSSNINTPGFTNKLPSKFVSYIASSFHFLRLMGPNNLSVVVDGIRNFNGRISIGLFKQGEGENLERAEDVYKGTRVQINEFAQAKFVFYNIPNGNYALSVLHDENSNNVMDKGFFGIPLEGYAFSNNVKPLMRSATFNEAGFSIYNVDKNISIHISY
jgi:uncharacterized protein (DUF2141 family)